jgi:hypothetical protein
MNTTPDISAAAHRPTDVIPLAQALQQARAGLAQAHPPAAVQAQVFAALPTPPTHRWRAWWEEHVLNWIVAGGRVRTLRIVVLALGVGVLAGGTAL